LTGLVAADVVFMLNQNMEMNQMYMLFSGFVIFKNYFGLF